jgi:hypothetical protein
MNFLRWLFGKRESQSLGKDQLFKICTEILLRLDLTHVEGVDEVPSLTRMLVEDKGLANGLASRIAAASFKAYKESGGNPDRYLPLCAQYLQG